MGFRSFSCWLSGFEFRVFGFRVLGVGVPKRVSGFGIDQLGSGDNLAPRASPRVAARDTRPASGRSALQFRGGLVFKARRLLYHSTLGSRVIKKKRRSALLARFGLNFSVNSPLIACA